MICAKSYAFIILHITSAKPFCVSFHRTSDCLTFSQALQNQAFHPPKQCKCPCWRQRCTVFPTRRCICPDIRRIMRGRPVRFRRQDTPPSSRHRRTGYTPHSADSTPLVRTLFYVSRYPLLRDQSCRLYFSPSRSHIITARALFPVSSRSLSYFVQKPRRL